MPPCTRAHAGSCPSRPSGISISSASQHQGSCCAVSMRISKGCLLGVSSAPESAGEQNRCNHERCCRGQAQVRAACPAEPPLGRQRSPALLAPRPRRRRPGVLRVDPARSRPQGPWLELAGGFLFWVPGSAAGATATREAVQLPRRLQGGRGGFTVDAEAATLPGACARPCSTGPRLPALRSPCIQHF